MNNVNSRKLFRKSQARDKLREMGGIMASSPELMQTVAKYNIGGPVPFVDAEDVNVINYPRVADRYSYDRLRSRPPGALSAEEKDQLQQFQQRFGINKPQGFPAKIDQFISNLFTSAPPRPAEEIQMFGRGVDAEDVNVKPAQRAGTEADQQYSNQLIDPYFQDLTAPQSPSDFRMPGVTPDPEVDVKPVVTPEPVQADGAARDEGRAPMAANDPQIIAAKKGELGAEAQVKAIVTTGTKQEKEKSLQDLMSEFTGAAPKYEGMDKGLAIAKIGFAMAAGKSSNAMTNIASALEKGADMFIKDKKDRDAFNRQVQLSALQYGFGEIGKQRAQDRLDKRTFREYVASEDTEYNGKKYKAGENILVSQADILANDGRIPSGLADKAVYAAGIKAAADKQKGFNDAVQKLTEEAVLKDSTATKITEDYGSAVSNFQSAEVGVQLLENAILDVADGKVTGFANGFQSAMNKVANAAGVDLGQKFESVDQFKATLRRAFQKLIPTTLGEAQSANSISNRDVEFLADAYINAGALQNGVFSLSFVDENVLIGQLQGAIGEFRKSQRGSLDEMTALEGRLYGRTLPGTRAPASTLVDPYRQSMSPYTPEQTKSSVGLVKGDDGIFRLQ